ncbi:MAG: hypothetical protein E7597_04600 [Ruminococcaceae bacterium]|nr:hypothetical protein [Oscillospiraceae bacterium]
MKFTKVQVITLCLFVLTLPPLFIFRHDILMTTVIGCLSTSFMHLFSYYKAFGDKPQNQKRFFKICMSLSWIWQLIVFNVLAFSELIGQGLSIIWYIGVFVCYVIYQKRFAPNDDETSNAK